MSEGWTIDSKHTLQAFISNVTELWEEHKHITYGAPRIGPDRSIDQNALFHVWLTEYAAHLLNKTKKDVTKGEVEGMKRHVKREYCREFSSQFSCKFIVHLVINPKTGETKRDYTSSKDWKQPEMYHVLTWLQMKAANDGLILESKGKFAKLKREETEV